jgi:predicted RNA methylase
VDLMAGTGSFGMAAILTGRSVLMVEQAKEIEQIKVITKRVKEIITAVGEGSTDFEELRDIIGD